MDLNHLLQSLGLEHQEANVYLAALRLGTSPASNIAKRCKIPRSTARYTCEQLVQKQLMVESQRKNTKLYTPENPEKLKKLLEIQMEEVQIKHQQLDVAMHDLKQIFNPYTVMPKVQFYEGEEEMIRLYERILDRREPIDSFEEAGELFELFPDYPDEFVKKRIDRKIFNRCIAPKGNRLNVSNPERLIEVKYLDPKQYPFTWHVKICGDLVGIFSFQKHASMAIAIQHADISKNFRLLFEFFWKTLPN